MAFQTTRLIKRYRVSQGHLSAWRSFFNLSHPRSMPVSPFADQDLGIREEGKGQKRVAINQGVGNQEIGRSVLWERNPNHMWQQQKREQSNRINAVGENEIRSLKASGSMGTYWTYTRDVLTPNPRTSTNLNQNNLTGILTPWLTNTKISHHLLRRHTWTHALNVLSDLVIPLSLFVVFIRCLGLDVCVELIKASGLILGLRPKGVKWVFSAGPFWIVLLVSAQQCCTSPPKCASASQTTVLWNV